MIALAPSVVPLLSKVNAQSVNLDNMNRHPKSSLTTIKTNDIVTTYYQLTYGNM